MSIAEWLRLAGSCVVGLLGLFVASRGGEGNIYAIGVMLFVAGLAYAFTLIKQHFDRVDGIQH